MPKKSLHKGKRINSIKMAGHHLQPLNGRVQEFHTEVRKLSRPYVQISSEDWQRLMAGPADYYLMDRNQVVTFGSADGGYALMPLMPQHARLILKRKSN